MRSTLTTFGMVIQSFVDQGALPRNVIALVERPADAIIDETSGTSKSWTLAEVERFRDSVRHDRLYACWLLSCYGLRRSEVLGLGRHRRLGGQEQCQARITGEAAVVPDPVQVRIRLSDCRGPLLRDRMRCGRDGEGADDARDPAPALSAATSSTVSRWVNDNAVK